MDVKLINPRISVHKRTESGAEIPGPGISLERWDRGPNASDQVTGRGYRLWPL